MTTSRVSRLTAESLTAFQATPRVSRLSVEALSRVTAAPRVSRLALEVLCDQDPNAPTYVGGGTASGTNATDNTGLISPVLPATVQDGDLGLLTYATTVDVATLPAGWTVVYGGLTPATGNTVVLLTKRLTAAEAGTAVTTTSVAGGYGTTARGSGAVAVYRNATILGDVRRTEWSSVASQVVPGMASTVPGSMVVLMHGTGTTVSQTASIVGSNNNFSQRLLVNARAVSSVSDQEIGLPATSDPVTITGSAVPKTTYQMVLVPKFPVTVSGGTALETDMPPKGVVGARASEVDAVRAGSIGQATRGGRASEGDAARAGTVSKSAPPRVDAVLTLDQDYTYDSDQISSADLIDGTYWWSYTPTDVVDLTFDLGDTVPVDWVPTVDPNTDVESDPPPVDVALTIYAGLSVDAPILATGASVTPALAVGTTYYVQASITGDDVLYQLSVGPAADTDLYLMDLEVLSGPLRTAPTAVTVQVMGGPPDDTVTFKIDGVDVPGTWDLDPFGNLPPTSVAVPDGTTKGDHIISVHSGSTDLAGEGTFTLLRKPYAALQIVGMDADPVEIPEANTSTGVRRWVLQDLMPGGLGSWVMVRNPTSMSSPEYQRTLFQEHTTAKDGQYHLSSVALQSFEWTFSGYIDTEFEQNQLLAYYGLNRRFYVIDHRTRAWIVAWQRCEIVPRKRQRGDDSSFNDWAADYTVTALIYDQDPKEPR